jgi:hypothetical protein
MSEGKELQKINKLEIADISEAKINALKARYDLFRTLQEKVLEKDVDYGFPFESNKPLTPSSKPSLYKSGAEKLCILFNLQPKFEILKEIEEKDFVLYKFKCFLINRETYEIVGEGFGVANSEEKRHWKSAPLANANTILKIAEKRALVDAVLKTTGASNIFTQDIEDYDELPIQEQNTNIYKQEIMASQKQLDYLNNLVNKYADLTKKDKTEIIQNILKTYKAENLSKLTIEEASTIIEQLNSYIKKASKKNKNTAQKNQTVITQSDNQTLEITPELVTEMLDEYVQKFPDNDDFFMIKNENNLTKYAILKYALEHNITVAEIYGQNLVEKAMQEL